MMTFLFIKQDRKLGMYNHLGSILNSFAILIYFLGLEFYNNI